MWGSAPNPEIFVDVIRLLGGKDSGDRVALNHVTVIGVPACTVS